MIETVIVCPLGSSCEEVKDGKIYRCGFYETLRGRNNQTGEDEDISLCGIRAMVRLQAETNYSQRATGEAVVSMREETIKRQDAFLGLAQQARLENAN